MAYEQIRESIRFARLPILHNFNGGLFIIWNISAKSDGEAENDGVLGRLSLRTE